MTSTRGPGTAATGWEQLLVAAEPSARGSAGNAGRGGDTKDALSPAPGPANPTHAPSEVSPARAPLGLMPGMGHGALLAFNWGDVCIFLHISPRFYFYFCILEAI